ncbi:ankyrin repeat-containing domain protein, partial [Phascolomyces articulosus]
HKQLLDIIENDLDSNSQVQGRLRAAIEALSIKYTTRYNTLLQSFENLESVHRNMVHEMVFQQNHYDKAVREMRFYKSQYEQLRQRQIRQQRTSPIFLDDDAILAWQRRISSASPINHHHSHKDDENQTIDLMSVLAMSTDHQDRETMSTSPVKNDNNNNESIMDPYIKMRAMPLIFACTEGFWNMIARGKNNKVEVDSLISNYLRRGGQPNVAKNSATIKSVKEGYGLIHALISVKNGSALARVVEAGANPNVVTLSSEPSDRTTPLVLAAQLNYLTGIRLLLERARADIFQRGPGQVTALHMALEHGADDDLVIYLVRASKNALLDIVDVEGATPLHYACKYGRIKAMVMFIRDCHVQLDPRDNKGETPLHYAVRQRRLKVITRLLGDFGVYPNYYVVKQTPTPLDLAKLGGFESISEYLRQMGAKTTKEM